MQGWREIHSSLQFYDSVTSTLQPIRAIPPHFPVSQDLQFLARKTEVP